MTTTLTIGHGNAHNRPEILDMIRDTDPDSFGCNEVQKMTDQLRALPGRRVIGGSEGWDEPRNRGNSSAIITSNDRASLGRLERQVSERLPNYERIAPDRVLHGSFFEHPLATSLGFEGIAHWELHPDAAMMRQDPSHPIVREYREALRSTRQWMRCATDDGLLNVLTGDLQASETFRADYSPRAILAGPLNLSVMVVGIDWIMVDPLLRFVGPLHLRQLYDHAGFVATIGARR